MELRPARPGRPGLLGAVSVFASWFDVDAAAAITEPASTRPDVADALARLADHHLLVVTPGQPTRYRVLETIRQYADERLSRAGQADTVRDRHRAWCRDRLSVLAGQEHDDDWCVRFDRVADDVRAAIMWAAERGIDEPAAALAEPLAEQLLLRGQLAEAQRRYEQAARHAPPGRERVRLLRLAAGTAAARVTGNDALRLLDEATTEALAIEDRDTAAECRAWMVIYLRMMPGIMAVVPSADEGARWLEEARGYATDSPVAEAAIGVATAAGLPESDPDSTGLAARALALAHDADAPLVESVALDQLCGVPLARGDLTAAIEGVRRRGQVLDTLPLDASTAYQFNDYLLMAAEIHLAAGNLTEAGQLRRPARRLGHLPRAVPSGHLPADQGGRDGRRPRPGGRAGRAVPGRLGARRAADRRDPQRHHVRAGHGARAARGRRAPPRLDRGHRCRVRRPGAAGGLSHRLRPDLRRPGRPGPE